MISAVFRNGYQFWRGSPSVVYGVAALALVLHCIFNGGYGIFRDELGYLACGEHPAWGYVDQPPLIPWLAQLSRDLFGDSLRAIRFVPALASSILIIQTAALTRLLGGQAFAQLLAAVAVALAPQYLSNAGLLGTNSLEPNLWMGCAYFAITAIGRAEPKRWLWFGVLLGIGLEEKYTIALFAFSIALGLVLTRERAQLAHRWPWFGAAAAFLLFLPNLLWNASHGWPFLQLMHAIRDEGRDVVLPFGEYFAQQLLLVGVCAAPIWVAGLATLLFGPKWKTFRFLGIAYLVCYGTLFLLHGKNYYLAPIYPMLLAAGAASIESVLNRASFQRWAQVAIVVIILGTGVYFAPIVVPVFSPEQFIAYAKNLPFKLPVMERAHAKALLPQWYSDQFGWKEIADAAASVYESLPPERRANCAIFGEDYGIAGAVDFFGPKMALPQALSGDRTYFLWGPGGYDGDCVIALGASKEKLEELWSDVDLLTTSAPSEWALEQEVPVYVCLGKKFASLSDIWPSVKRWR